MTATNNAVKGGQVPLKNVASFMAMTVRLQERSPSLPGFAVYFGPSGFGKTESSIYVQNKTSAVRVEIGETWSIKKFLQELLFELRRPAKGTISDLADQAKAALGDDPRRPLIIDEADKLLRKNGMLEVVREIGDVAGCPVILIGEEMLPEKLAVHERFHNRVLDWTGAEPCDADDVAKLAASLCGQRGITIAPDLQAEICRQSDGRARRICTNLDAALQIARNQGLTTVDLAAWGATRFYTNKPPGARYVSAPRRSA
ncbi:transposase [Rhodopseudomonas sp. AAP120]|uniref:AAA family ATPase n=1 Tax=Rhodopseudomonas sp. AAP120 TaxID=1523430 RepID=UPI0006B96CA1|nr:ATP-binding protein [Rhodopseudomonas sp. AAP120]KPF98872.1 transposase [Rhodopseudomonas sp. AAP120]